jgi:flavin reductase (DIM6/NTAB) family NADH-FMN oxidoreductase RutF
VNKPPFSELFGRIKDHRDSFVHCEPGDLPSERGYVKECGLLDDICCSQPPCLAVSLRAATYTHGNLMERRAFTVSVPSQAQVKAADYFGLVSGRDTDKFAATGLTAVRSDLVDAPYVQEFPLVLECRVVQIHELGLHTQFVGQILDVKADEEALDAAGLPDILKMLPLIFSPGNREYYGVGSALGHAFAVGKEI